MQVRYVLNQHQKNLTLSREILPLLKHLEFSVCQTKIGRRIIYAECAAQGKTIFQTKHKLAQQEIQQLTSEIVKLL
ncbi:MAG: ParA family protein [Mycoplasmataceae bacterium CE_OT135]|nr:MAG: ParA family protein [Mycoplasmataceae bacterium CE_OT135]